MFDIKAFFRTLPGRLSIVVVVAVGFFVAGQMAYNTLSYRLAQSELADLNAQVLRRSELAADYAVIALTGLSASGSDTCSASSLELMRRTIYERGAIKNILVLGDGGEVRCSGIPGTAEFDFLGINLFRGFPARNESIMFHELHSNDVGLIGITWRFSNSVLLAVVNVDSILFDALPADLRDRSELSLNLGNDRPFARRAAMAGVADDAKLVSFVSKSDRFPLTARLDVPEDLLSSHARPFALEFAIAAWMIGLAFGWLLARLAARPSDQRHRMRRALKNHEFKPFMQPIFSLEDRRITGCEVLARWVLPDGHVLPPSRFIDAAEDNGLIVPMTRALMQMALSDLKPVLNRDRGFTVAFNIVPADLVQPGFVKEMCELVEACGARPEQVVLELTERQEFTDTAVAGHVIDALHEHGFRVALDDTGTGHNGLSYVQDLGVDIIKIDKKFIDLVAAPDAKSYVVDSLVGLARSLGMATVAEGIETEEQALALGALGVDKGQGYLVSPPVAAPVFIKLVERSRAARVVSLESRRAQIHRA